MKHRIFAAAAACILCLSLTGCGHAGKTYTEYVKAVMDCTYLGDTQEYRALTKASETDAEAVHQEAIGYLSEQLCYQASVDRDSLDAETVKGYDDLAASLIGKVKYSASNAVKAGEIYQITITSEPLDLWDLSISELETCYKDKYAKAFYNETPGSDSYKDLEAAWGAQALEIYNAHADAVANKEAQTITTVLYADSTGHYTMSQDSWRHIDELVFGISK